MSPGRPPSRGLAVGLAVAVLLLGGVVACGSGDDATVRPRWHRAGGDEFDGAALDGAWWQAYHSTYGDGNAELACLRPGNVAVADGELRITARREEVVCPHGRARSHSSGFVGSREVGRYLPLEVRVEVRARLPHAQGIWPAAWLRHRDGASTAEVDLLEYFHARTPGRTNQALHLDGARNVLVATTPVEAPTDDPAWHTWGVEVRRVDDDGDGERDDVRFRFTLDGETTETYVDTRHRWAEDVDPEATWDLAVNLAVGGRPAGDPDGPLGHLDDPDRCSQDGEVPDCDVTGIRRVDWARGGSATRTYRVDWVRVWRLQR